MSILQGTLTINNHGFGIIKNDVIKKKIRVDKKNLNYNISDVLVQFEILKENDFIIYAKVISEPNLNGMFFYGYFHHNYKTNTFLYNTRFGKSNLIMCDINKNLKNSDIVSFSITKFKNGKYYGRIKKKIGTFFDTKSVTKLLINEFNLKNEFPKKITKEINLIKKKYFIDFENEIKKRKNLTNFNTFTIDPIGARDLDDAISVEKKNKFYKVFIHIADVSHFIKENTHIDKEALNRSFSVYLPSKVIRMLPSELSEDLCSLIPGSCKYAVTTEVNIDFKGKVLNWKIYKSLIESNYKFTYEEVFDILENNKDNKYLKELKMLKEISDLLKNTRIRLPDKKFNDITKEMEVFFHDYSHSMIEELMILNNILVSKELSKKNVKYPNRYHPSINLDNSNLKLIEKINNTKISNYSVKNIQKIIKKNMDNKINFNILLNLYLLQSSMNKATYQDNKNGHWALNLKYYSHFTSPIRRFPDLISHRLIFNENKKNVSNMLKIVNDNEYKYQKIDFFTENLNIIKFLELNKDHFMKKIFDGVITKVSNPSITIFIPNIYWVKNIHISELSDIKMNYNEENNSFSYNEKKIEEGSIVKMKINKINLIFQEIKFDILNKIEN